MFGNFEKANVLNAITQNGYFFNLKKNPFSYFLMSNPKSARGNSKEERYASQECKNCATFGSSSHEARWRSHKALLGIGVVKE